jgi:hypothetical protein
MKLSAPDFCGSNGGEGMLYRPVPCQRGRLPGAHWSGKRLPKKPPKNRSVVQLFCIAARILPQILPN